jgi:hypothetical protein
VEADHSLQGFSSERFSSSMFKSPREPKTRSPEVNIDPPSKGTCGDRSITSAFSSGRFEALEVETPEARSVEACGDQQWIHVAHS